MFPWFFSFSYSSLGEGESSPEQAKLVHNFLYSGDRRYIESPLKPAPPPIIIRRSSLTQHKTSSSSTSSSSRKFSSSFVQENSSSSYKLSNKTVNDSSSFSSTRISSNNIDSALSTSTSSKKKYGKLDATGSPSRSRSATKELICKYLPPFCINYMDELHINQPVILHIHHNLPVIRLYHSYSTTWWFIDVQTRIQTTPAKLDHKRWRKIGSAMCGRWWSRATNHMVEKWQINLIVRNYEFEI